MKKFTIICPVYNEEKCIEKFIHEIKLFEKTIPNKYELNIFFSNNASTDNTLNLIKKNSEIYNNIFYQTLSRDCGYQKSMYLALKNIKSDLYTFIDCDLQDPPRLINNFLEEHEKGYDIVYGLREDRNENFFLKSGRKLFYRSLKLISDYDLPLDMAEFSLITYEVRNAIISENNSYPFLRANIGRVGFSKIGIPYKRDKRFSGKSYYNFYTLLVFGVAGTLSSSTFPLRLSLYLFPIWVILSSILIYLNLKLSNELFWKFFIIISLFYITIILIFLSVYGARSYNNTLNRPLGFVDKKNSYMPPSHNE
jgi:glycosyltransferase involved in cell wall biosynthesis